MSRERSVNSNVDRNWALNSIKEIVGWNKIWINMNLLMHTTHYGRVHSTVNSAEQISCRRGKCLSQTRPSSLQRPFNPFPTVPSSSHISCYRNKSLYKSIHCLKVYNNNFFCSLTRLLTSVPVFVESVQSKGGLRNNEIKETATEWEIDSC